MTLIDETAEKMIIVIVMVAIVETGEVNHQIAAGDNSLHHPNGFIIVALGEAVVVAAVEAVINGMEAVEVVEVALAIGEINGMIIQIIVIADMMTDAVEAEATVTTKITVTNVAVISTGQSETKTAIRAAEVATVQKVVAAIGTQISRTIALKQWDQTAVIMARSVQCSLQDQVIGQLPQATTHLNSSNGCNGNNKVQLCRQHNTQVSNSISRLIIRNGINSNNNRHPVGKLGLSMLKRME